MLRALGVHRIRLLTNNPLKMAALAEFEAGTEKVAITAAPLAQGFFWHEPAEQRAIQFFTETELFASAPSTRRRKKQEQVSNVDALIKDLSELNLGDPVVHIAHGIGRYRGLINLDMGEKNADGTPAAAALTLGKRLSNKLYLSYESSLAGAMGTVSMFYDLSRRITVRARAGEENAIDLIFTTSFD
eukprot:gene36985-biopygen29255